MESTSLHVTCSLRPTPTEREALYDTCEAFEEAVLLAIKAGWKAETTGNAVIHRLCYEQIRSRFELPANLAVRAIACAARRLKAHPLNPVTQLLNGHNPRRRVWENRRIEYDARTLSLAPEANAVSLSSLAGRLRRVEIDETSFGSNHLIGMRPLSGRLEIEPEDLFLLEMELCVKEEGKM